jgi:hypothetical protein
MRSKKRIRFGRRGIVKDLNKDEELKKKKNNGEGLKNKMRGWRKLSYGRRRN